VALDDVAHHRDVHVVAQKAVARFHLEPLGFRKPAALQVVEEGALDLGTLPRSEKVRPSRCHGASVPLRLFEAEREDGYFPGPPPHRGRDLAREERSRRARHEQLDFLRVKEPPHETLPARDDLDLVEAPSYGLPAAQRREATVVLLDEFSPSSKANIKQIYPPWKEIWRHPPPRSRSGVRERCRG